MALNMLLVTTIALACPPIFPMSNTAVWKWLTMIAAFCLIVSGRLSTYARIFF